VQEVKLFYAKSVKEMEKLFKNFFSPKYTGKSMNLEECVLHAIAKALTNTYFHVNGARKEIHLFPILCLAKP
jgi:hypothetical protein